MEYPIIDNENKLDISNLKPGSYILHATDNKTKISEMLIKE